MINKIKILAFLAVLFLFSCQKEETEIIETPSEETIAANSTLATALKNVATLDGSLDNIIDNASCLTVQLPVTVTANGQMVTITTLDDLFIIESIFNEFSTDTDTLVITYPITLILPDFTEVIVNSDTELATQVATCGPENSLDDDIECIDFDYPINVSVYDTNFQVIGSDVLNDDNDMYDFINDLEDGILVSVNYPITLILFDGAAVVVNSNTELVNQISLHNDDCDEDDDNDFEDDDPNISVSDLENMMMDGQWEVDKLEINEVDLEDDYDDFTFTFLTSNVVEVVDEATSTTHTGTWSIISTASATKLDLQLPTLTDFNNANWILHEIETNNEIKIDYRIGEDRLQFEKI